MKIDTIKKKETGSKNVIDLRKNKNRDVFDVKEIFANKNNYFFYSILALLMIFMLFIWFLSFRNSMKVNKEKEAENKIKYERVLNTYQKTKEELSASIEDIKNKIKEMNDAKKNISTDQQTSRDSSEDKIGTILNSIKEEDKAAVLEGVQSTDADKEIQDNLKQKELQYKLDSIR